ncbi:alpha/beta hydrolase [Streptomyces sp. NPDC058296]|uniref:alpha/beta hydrolase n=1 Tax=Streptomyces sp. NPDC058296 TaxID=3346432 RepID=UPI0036EF7F7E
MMRRQAQSSTRITGRRELHDLGNRACHVPGHRRADRTSRTGRHATTPKPCPADWTGISDRDRLAFAYSCSGDEPYELGEEPQHQPGIPRGKIHEHRLRDSTVYAGVPHRYWVYVPAQYDGSADAALLVFLDGQIYLSPAVNTPAVLDNLIAAGDIPVTIAVFVDPGPNGPGLPVYGGSDNRSREYDSLGGDYARFLLEDLLPGIEQSYRVTAEPTRRGICGIRSAHSPWHGSAPTRSAMSSATAAVSRTSEAVTPTRP